MARAIGEAYVQVSMEDIREMRDLLTDPSFVHAVGTDLVPKWAGVLMLAEHRIKTFGNITAKERDDG